ncbi:LytR/AlgR family response regulator transcription factor [Neolewinella agarilytica]|uniref:Two component transcriptional regulator, LytTR family n=1 Tax=Neolewinella agarilytica TaxID=478744 RepID=A0A1H9K580_9BACT|nr:LytTR family DNA-binding domain-containing protein [Neolewinella agarilytica]SEQ94386.1 two component transcriptional regulator, LytTR family [Neolewinella agarilytica]
MYKALVVDDEPDARGVVHKTLKLFCPEIDEVFEAEDGAEALTLARKTRFDLAFLDIQLNGEDGVDLAKSLAAFCPNIIFVTAHDEHAIRAFQTNAVHYLLKPIEPGDLRQAIARVKDRTKQEGSEFTDKYKSIRITTGGVTRMIPFESIIFLKGSGNYSTFFLDTGEELFLSRGLSYYEQKLLKEGFFRVHQSYLVNLKHVSGVSHKDTLIMLTSGDSVSLSRRKKREFLKQIDRFY